MLKADATVGEQACYQRQEAVIQAYKSLGTLSKAAQECDVLPNTAYMWVAEDRHGFNARLARDGLTGYRDHLEAMVNSRLEDPTGNRGSDVLLMGALNANHPDKWSRNIQVTHEVGRDVMATLKAIQEQQKPADQGQVIEHEPWRALPREGKALPEKKDD